MQGKYIRPLLKGFVPVYKPAGLSFQNLSRLMSLEVRNSVPEANRIVCYCLSSIHTFASGVVTIAFGGDNDFFWSFQEFAHFRNILKIKILNTTLNAQQLGKNLSQQDIVNCITGYSGILNQPKSPFLYHELINPVRNFSGFDSDFKNLSEAEKIYCGIDISYKHKMNDKPKFQKYPLNHQLWKINVEKFNLIDYQPPFITLDLLTQGNIGISHLIEDLSDRLKKPIHLVSCNRTQEGFVSADGPLKIFQFHELHFENFFDVMALNRNIYLPYLKRLPLDETRRADRHRKNAVKDRKSRSASSLSIWSTPDS